MRMDGWRQRTYKRKDLPKAGCADGGVQTPTWPQVMDGLSFAGSNEASSSSAPSTFQPCERRCAGELGYSCTTHDFME